MQEFYEDSGKKERLLNSFMDFSRDIQCTGTTYCIAAQQGLGDVILITPLFTGIVAKMRKIDRLIVMVAGKAMADYLQDRFPDTVFEFLYCNAKGVRRYWQLIQHAVYLRKQRIDYFFGCGFWDSTVAKTAWIKTVSAKYNVLPASIPGHFLFPKASYVGNREDGTHKSEYANQFLLCLEWPGMPLIPHYPLPDGSRLLQEEKMNKIFGDGRRYISVVPCSNGVQAYKQWPVKNYIKLIRRLTEKYADIRFMVFCQGESEQRLVQLICRELPTEVTYIAKDTSIQESRELFSISQIVIGADSGGMHLASTVADTRCLIMFGPADSSETGPHFSAENVKVISSKAECAPCIKFADGKRTVCRNGYSCMDKITVDEVFLCVSEILDGGIDANGAAQNYSGYSGI